MINSSPESANKSHRNLFIVLGVLLGCICLCVGVLGLCGGAVGIAFGAQVAKYIKEEPRVLSVIDDYMFAMAGKDTATAYEFFSTRSKRNFSLADLEQYLEDSHYTLFDGYRSVTILELFLNTSYAPASDMPQGEIAEVYGTVTYGSGITGNFTAVLEKEGDVWRLFSIELDVPLDKIDL